MKIENCYRTLRRIFFFSYLGNLFSGFLFFKYFFSFVLSSTSIFHSLGIEQVSGDVFKLERKKGGESFFVFYLIFFYYYLFSFFSLFSSDFKLGLFR